MYYAISHYVTGDCKVLSFHFVLRSLTTIINAGNWVDFSFFGARLVIQSDIPIIVNWLFSKWLLVVPLCMLSVAAQYKMHTERLITVSVLSGQIDSGTGWPWSTWKNGPWNREREHLVVWYAVGVSDHTLYVLIDHLWDLVLPMILMRMADWSEP